MALRSWGTFGLSVTIAVTMLAVGVWHGRNATFILAGSLYAIYMIGSTLTLRAREKWWKKRFGKKIPPVLDLARKTFGALVVFHMIVFAFIPVRSANVGTALYIQREFVRGFGTRPSIASLEGWSNQQTALLLLGIIVMEIVHIGQSRGWNTHLDARPRWQRWAAYYALGLMLLFFASAKTASFIYFKF
jgi:alginate O-acetyltransferase complex protein AlgI